MEILLKPDTFDTLPNMESSTKNWVHWKARFNKFVQKCKDITEEDKKDLLVNLISPDIYPYVQDCTDLQQAMDTLDKMYNPVKALSLQGIN